MIVTIHQPEHFPYMGFFQKMKKSDVFVCLDNVRFRKNYFQNRNRFPNKNGIDEWFGVPVSKNCSSTIIKDVLVNDKAQNQWYRKVVNKISYNFGHDFSEIYSYNTLLEINMRGIEWAREQMKIETPIVYASQLGVSGSKTELLVDICRALNAETYLSGPSGINYLDVDLFEEIKVEFFKPNVKNYYSCVYNLS
tara:strand:+ start:13608 stop:14189 length:582 start_codon:yes stop_codon:yes gene_type:complete